jgi:hypothetical protein
VNKLKLHVNKIFSMNRFYYNTTLVTKNMLQSKTRINIYGSNSLRERVVKAKQISSRLSRLAKPNIRRVTSVFKQAAKKSKFDMMQAEKFAKLLLDKKSRCLCGADNCSCVNYERQERKCKEIRRCCCENIARIRKLEAQIKQLKRPTTQYEGKMNLLKFTNFTDKIFSARKSQFPTKRESHFIKSK